MCTMNMSRCIYLPHEYIAKSFPSHPVLNNLHMLSMYLYNNNQYSLAYIVMKHVTVLKQT